MTKPFQGEAAGPLYPHINTVWKRNRTTNRVLLGDYAQPEFEYLADTPWWWFEKVDGTNIRLHWNGDRVLIGGRKDTSQIHAGLHQRLLELIPLAVRWHDIFDDETDDPISPSVTIYGEGYGAGIQKGGAYSDQPEFIVFDINVGGWWLQWPDVCDVAEKLGFATVPFLGESTLTRVVNIIRAGEQESAWPGVEPEGLVGRPRVELHTRRGDRILVKVKRVDYL